MQYKKEELESMPLSRLLRVYVQADKAANEKNQLSYFSLVEEVILNNFTEKPTVELQKAYDAVDAMNLSEKVKQEVKQVKYCAFDIAQHLDPMNVSGMAMLKKIIEERVSVAEKILEGLK